MLKIKKGELTLTEQTLMELVRAVHKARRETDFTDEPMPDSDMSTEQYIQEKRKRGTILVSSDYASLDFNIILEKVGDEQESLGYKLK